MSAMTKDWLERFEPLRPLKTDRWARNILCRDRHSGALVSVSVVRPATRWHVPDTPLAHEALRREAETLAALAEAPGEPVFPRLVDASLEGPSPWIAVEYLDGPTLREALPIDTDGAIAPERGWTLPQILQAILGLQEGLQALHRRGAAHGFLHPANLILEGEYDPAAASPPRLRLRDLGWAACPPGAAVLPGRDALPYLAPSVLERPVPPGPDSDAWSLAAILWEQVAGRPPFASGGAEFDHEDRFAVRRAISLGLPSGLPAHLPADLADLFRRHLTAEASIAALFSDLARCLDKVRHDVLWRRARLPNPDLGALRELLRSERKPPPAEILARHEALWARWRESAAGLQEGFARLGPEAAEPPWPEWQDEVARDAAACLEHGPSDDADRADAEALPGRLREIEERLTRLNGIAAAAARLLAGSLGRLVEEAATSAGAAGDPAMAEAIGAFRSGVERLGREPAGPGLVLEALRLRSDGEALRLRAARAAAEAEFRVAAGQDDPARAREILKRWPGGAEANSRRLEQGLEAWRALAEPAAGLLRGERTPDRLRAIADLAGRIASSAPAGFEDAGRALTARLQGAIEAVRVAARSAVEEARTFVDGLEKAAEVAAERALQDGLPDQAGAAAFCRALERLEKDLADTARRTEGALGDLAACLEVPGRLGALRQAASDARQAWWPGEAVPATRKEWAAFEARVDGLAGRGGRGLREARQLLEKQVPAGWSVAAQRILEKLPPPPEAPGLSQRLTKGPALAGLAVAVAATIGIAVWSLWPRLAPEPAGVVPAATPQPSPEPAGAGAAQARLETAWIHAPFLPGLTLQLDSDGRPPGSAIRLPGEVTFPVGTDLTVHLAWDSGGPREVRAAFAGGGDLQAKVNDLLAGVSPDGARVQSLDRVVDAWAGDLLKAQP
jgi:hypothetical protein